MVPGLAKKSEIVKGYIAQRVVELVNQEIEVDFLKSQELLVSHAQWKDWNAGYTKAKSSVTEIKRILKVLESKYDEYLLAEADEEAEMKQVVAKKADK